MIGQRLKELRFSAGVKSKAEAARIFDMPYTTYVNYENGSREPGSEELLMFAAKYNVTVDYLLGKVDIPTPPNAKKGLDREKIGQDLTEILRATGYNSESLTNEEANDLLQILITAHKAIKKNPKQ